MTPHEPSPLAITAAPPMRAITAGPSVDVADPVEAFVPPVDVLAAEPAVPVRRRRRWPWIALAVVVLLIAGVVGGGLWFVSGMVGDGARIARPEVGFPLAVTQAEGPGVTYETPEEVAGESIDSGLMGIASADGAYVQSTDPAAAGATTTRTITGQVIGEPLVAGDEVTLDPWYYPRNPQVGLGLDYEDVTYDAPSGPTPAWFIPGTSSTWVVFTHGRGATPAEGLRIAQVANGLGYPTLMIRYRNDARAPGGDGYGQFGADEWRDLEAAVQYALDHGAERVVVAGASMGGAITLAFLLNSPLAADVAGAFLDSPATDFGGVVENGASRMGLPGFVTSAAMTVASWRYGFDWGATDYATRAGELRTPTVIVQGAADPVVPPALTRQFAEAAAAGVVRLVEVPEAGHVTAWNVDRAGYSDLLGGFLTEVAPAG